MKTFITLNNYPPAHRDSEKAWYLLADSAITNTGKPFYIPENLGEVFVSLCPAFRINRLGKHIDRKFASRYYTEMAPALHFYLPEYAEELKKQGLPTDAAFNFDRALFVGDFAPISETDILELTLSEEKIEEFDLSNLYMSPADILQKVSFLNTVKMGDILVPGLSAGHKISELDILEVKYKGEKAFHIRVK